MKGTKFEVSAQRKLVIIFVKNRKIYSIHCIYFEELEDFTYLELKRRLQNSIPYPNESMEKKSWNFKFSMRS